MEQGQKVSCRDSRVKQEAGHWGRKVGAVLDAFVERGLRGSDRHIPP